MSVRLRNVTPDDLELREFGQVVKANGIATVPGRVVSSRPEPKEGEVPNPLPEDAVVTEHDGVERVWAKSVWSLVGEQKTSKNEE